MPTACAVRLWYLVLASLGPWVGSISNLLVLSVDVTGAFGADADNQARERLVLAFVLIAFSFGVSCLRVSYLIA